jgi:hypothetical protein
MISRHIFQACPVWIYTQSNITQISYSPEYITPTQQISSLCFIKLNISLFYRLALRYKTSTYSETDLYSEAKTLNIFLMYFRTNIVCLVMWFTTHIMLSAHTGGLCIY